MADTASEGLTVGLVDLVLRKVGDLPEPVYRLAESFVLDFLGVAIAGARTDEGRVMARTVSQWDRRGTAPTFADPRTFDAATAALVNGTLGYSIGLTDTHAVSITHPGPSVIPAALAVAQERGASGQDLLRAVVAGYETVVRIGSVVNPSHRHRGFHPTATCNPFGAAVAAGLVARLGAEQLAWALGLAGSMSGGLYEFRQDGAMLMALHGGWPAHGGVVAAQLAGNGFTGPATVLEGPDGFFRAFADTVSPHLLLADPDPAHCAIEEVSLRPYCACRYAHAAIDALERLRSAGNRVDPQDVDAITVRTHRTAVEQESEPTTTVSARLSTAFNVALAVVHGPRLSEVNASDLADPAVRAVTERVVVQEDPALTALFPQRWACSIQIRTRDGHVLTERVDIPKGEPENPLSAEEVRQKFLRLTAPIVGTDLAERTAQAVHGLRGPGGLDTLTAVQREVAERIAEGGPA